MNIELPYTYEVIATHRQTGERETLIHRDTLVARLRFVEREQFVPLCVTNEPPAVRRRMYGFEGRLYREITFMGVSVTPRAFEEQLSQIKPRRQDNRIETWPRRDFPRPPYVRCRLFEDRNALFVSPTDLPWGSAVFDFGAQPKRHEEARAAYEQDILTAGDSVWVAVPAPVYVLRQDRALNWHLRIEFQPTIWEAATTFSLYEADRAVLFADRMAFDLAGKDLADPAMVRAVGSATPSIFGLAASSAAQMWDGAPGFWITMSAESHRSAQEFLEELGGTNYPWEPNFRLHEAIAKPQLLRSRWLFELTDPQHAELSDRLWRDIDEAQPQIEDGQIDFLFADGRRLG